MNHHIGFSVTEEAPPINEPDDDVGKESLLKSLREKYEDTWDNSDDEVDSGSLLTSLREKYENKRYGDDNALYTGSLFMPYT